jgi:hypothetical protein
LVANLEVWRWRSAIVGRSLITLLSEPDIFLEVFVELQEIDCELMSTGRSERMFGIDGDVQMIAFVGKEWGDTSGGTRGVVEGKLGKRQEVEPVVLLVCVVHAKILFESLISPFSLAIGLWVVARGEVELHVEGFAKSLEETRDKLRASVEGDMRGDTVFGEDMHDEEFGKSGRVNCIVSRDEYTLLAESVHDNEDCGEAVGVGKLLDEVHGD